MTRTVNYTFDKGSNLGVWRLACAQCPLLPHTEALGMKPRACADGLSTNIQGHVVINTCEHYAKDSLRNDAGVLKLECGKEAA